jgi:hypothetical protein
MGNDICFIQGCKDEIFNEIYCKKCYIEKQQEITPINKLFLPNKFIDCDDHHKIECYSKEGRIKDYILIDPGDVEGCQKYKWHIHKRGGYNNEVGLIHNFLLGYKTTGNEPRHINKNKLDNRRKNLR